MCSANTLIGMASLALILWGAKALSTCMFVEDSDDDDNALIAIMHGLPFILIGALLLLLSSGKREIVTKIFRFVVPTEQIGLPLAVTAGVLILGVAVLNYKIVIPWRLSRWARKRNLNFVSYKVDRRNFFSNAISGRSKYQSFYTVDFKDRQGQMRTADLIVGSYWGTNPNKIVVFWK